MKYHTQKYDLCSSIHVEFGFYFLDWIGIKVASLPDDSLPIPAPPAGSPPVCVLGGRNDFIVDVEGLEETAAWGGTTALVLARPYSITLVHFSAAPQAPFLGCVWWGFCWVVSLTKRLRLS